MSRNKQQERSKERTAVVTIPTLSSESLVQAEDHEQIPQIGTIETSPFRGGCITAVEPQQLQLGGFSWIQNMRQMHPGFQKRKGQTRLNSTEDTSGSIKSIYLFSKEENAENFLFMQNGNGDVVQGSFLPPSTITLLGTKVHTGETGNIPATWAAAMDRMIHADGTAPPNIFGGNTCIVQGFIKWAGSGTPPVIPDEGIDYTLDVIDSDDDTYADLGSMTNEQYIYIRSDLIPSALTLTVESANTNAATLSVEYYNGAWTSVAGMVDGTASSGKTLAKSGTITFTYPSSMISHYQFGMSGYWIRIKASATLSATVSISEASFKAPWQKLCNIWNGVPVMAVEVQKYISADNVYYTYPSSSIDLSGFGETGDVFYVFCIDRASGFYFDCGSTPNENSSDLSGITIKYFNGSSFVTVGTVNDGTDGLAHPGWVTFPRQSSAQQRQFNTNQYYAYIYQVSVTATTPLSDSVLTSIEVMPFFPDEEHGKTSCCASWKKRAVFGNTRDNHLFITAAGMPTCLNGSDFAVIDVGDGRKNKPLAMKRFYNELMVWQEEKGSEGGCLTLIEGYSPATFGTLVLSSRIGVVNGKSAEVVEGVFFNTGSDSDSERTVAFWISRHGVYASDGTSVINMSRNIANYFDQTKVECIRAGYESEHWLSYDQTYHVLRLGLVSGPTATKPNVFPVYDLTDNEWMFDSFGQTISCSCDISSSGNTPFVHVGGGAEDGYVYLMNTTNNDVDTPIDAYCQMELNARGMYMLLREIILRIKKGEGGCTITPYVDGTLGDIITIDE